MAKIGESGGLKRTESSGLLLALAGFTILSLGDGVIKTMAGLWPAPAIAALRYALGAIGLCSLLLLREGPRPLRQVPRPKIQLLRGLAVSMATVGFFSAVFVMPLAEATTITFSSPMITGLLAVIFLGEPARRETWIATMIAFAGVLVVLRPNFAALGWAAFLPLLSAVGMSLLVIGNRAVAGAASALAMQAYVAGAAAPILVLAAIAGHLGGWPGLVLSSPDWSVIARCALVACTASAAHWLIFLGTTRAGAASIAPMTYVQLLVATTLGWLWFGEHPDGVTLAGAGVIVGAGIYLWNAGRRRDAVTRG